MALELFFIIHLYKFGTRACAWHRQVRRADARRSQAHVCAASGATKERRGGAEPPRLDRLRIGCRMPPCGLSYSVTCRVCGRPMA